MSNINDAEFMAVQVETFDEASKDRLYADTLNAQAKYDMLPVRVYIASNVKTGKSVEIEARSAREASEKRAKNSNWKLFMLEA